MFNGNPIPGAKEPLLVKFADGGNKKKSLYKQNDNNSRGWRDNTESITQVNMSIYLKTVLRKNIKYYSIKRGSLAYWVVWAFAFAANLNKCFRRSPRF